MVAYDNDSHVHRIGIFSFGTEYTITSKLNKNPNKNQPHLYFPIIQYLSNSTPVRNY